MTNCFLRERGSRTLPKDNYTKHLSLRP